MSTEEPQNTESQPQETERDDTTVVSKTRDETSTIEVQDDAGATTVTREQTVNGETHTV